MSLRKNALSFSDDNKFDFSRQFFKNTQTWDIHGVGAVVIRVDWQTDRRKETCSHVPNISNTSKNIKMIRNKTPMSAEMWWSGKIWGIPKMWWKLKYGGMNRGSTKRRFVEYSSQQHKHGGLIISGTYTRFTSYLLYNPTHAIFTL